MKNKANIRGRATHKNERHKRKGKKRKRNTTGEINKRVRESSWSANKVRKSEREEERD